MTQAQRDEYFMQLALREAEKAAVAGEVPTGCVIVDVSESPSGMMSSHAAVEKGGSVSPHEVQRCARGALDLPPDDVDALAHCRILARAHNQTEGLTDATAHAEMLALSQAFAEKGNWRLTGCRLYVTKEPCPMCAGAIVLARLDAVVWGVSDPKRGGSTVFDIFRHPGMNHHPELLPGVLETPCLSVLRSFFQARRAGRSGT